MACPMCWQSATTASAPRAGLTISEGVAVSQEGTGYLFTPGLYTDEQVVAWKRVTDAVHAEAGRTLYGAHYQLRAQREDDGQWRICWFDYRPGWFTDAEVPTFDIGVTHA